jgi:hypothetical protein
MSTAVLIQQPNVQFITDNEGKTLSAIVPINEYNTMLKIVEQYYYDDDDNFTDEELRRIALSHQQAQEGKLVKSEEVFKMLRAEYGN